MSGSEEKNVVTSFVLLKTVNIDILGDDGALVFGDAFSLSKYNFPNHSIIIICLFHNFFYICPFLSRSFNDLIVATFHFYSQTPLRHNVALIQSNWMPFCFVVAVQYNALNITTTTIIIPNQNVFRDNMRVPTTTKRMWKTILNLYNQQTEFFFVGMPVMYKNTAYNNDDNKNKNQPPLVYY